MKRCPNCNQVYSDDNAFCLEDGTMLLNSSEETQSYPVFPTPNNLPTQFISRPATDTFSASRSESSKWLFLVIGILATVVAVMAVFMFLPRNSSETEKVAESKESNVVANTNVNDSQTTNTMVQKKETFGNSTSKPAATPVSIDPNLNPLGRWTGEWTSKKGSLWTAELSLNDDGGGKVSGQILWTLRRTTNTQKMDKIGLTATEYVRGAYDPASRMLQISGYREDDPNDIFWMDKYRLILSENNQTLSGTTWNQGGWSGRLNMRR